MHILIAIMTPMHYKEDNKFLGMAINKLLGAMSVGTLGQSLSKLTTSIIVFIKFKCHAQLPASPSIYIDLCTLTSVEVQV